MMLLGRSFQGPVERRFGRDVLRVYQPVFVNVVGNILIMLRYVPLQFASAFPDPD